MTRTIPARTRLAAAVAAAVMIAAPVSASLWPAAPSSGTAPASATLDLARFDAMTRTGAAQVAADPYCDVREVVLMNLSESYGETMRSSLQHGQGSVLDLWASDEFGTWTAIYTRADGIACVIGSGVDWTPGMTADAALARVEA